MLWLKKINNLNKIQIFLQLIEMPQLDNYKKKLIKFKLNYSLKIQTNRKTMKKIQEEIFVLEAVRQNYKKKIIISKKVAIVNLRNS